MDVRKIAKLAHLEITEEEVALYTPQMANIVAYVEQLNELDTENVEPMLGGLTEEGKATATIARCAARISRTEKALDQAPRSRRGHFQVPKFYELQKFKIQVQNCAFSFLLLHLHFSFPRAACRIWKSPNARSQTVGKEFYSISFATR
jgi:aspartyl-tRNA(Asn)/glutamyl-tRNA(Gln) amidotransferase subunit C